MKPLRSTDGRNWEVDLAHFERKGGQAWVYRCAQGGRAWAVKVAQDAGRSNARIGREIDELRRLHAQHPDLERWLVPVEADGVLPDGRRFLVMPWYELDLETWLDQGQPLGARLHAAECACRAVVRLHRGEADWRQGVVHRDVKPSSFLVVERPGEFQLRLGDFGAVKRFSSPDSLTRGTGVHTPGYAPPDQMLPLRIPADRSWDTWALAVTVFQCVARRRPLGTEVAASMFTKEGLRLLATAGSHSGSEEGPEGPLSRADLRRLVRLDEIEAIEPEDRRLLEERLAADLAGRVAEPGALAAELGRELVDILGEYLAGDPNERNSGGRPLLKTASGSARGCDRPKKPAPAWSRPLPAPRTPRSTRAPPPAGSRPSPWPLPPRPPGPARSRASPASPSRSPASALPA